ncbi:hypothetical protein [Heliophilum fasciatum]|nr:hypothetical protein [Heliophilum fasciatum]MCW2278029.1 hypothetical protein [Heliophilum fasciatum]
MSSTVEAKHKSFQHSVEAWQPMIVRAFQQASSQVSAYFHYSSMMELIQRYQHTLAQQSAHWEAAPRRWFQFQGLLYAMKKVEELLKSAWAGSSQTWTMHYLEDAWFREFAALCEEHSAIVHDPQAQGSRQLIHERLWSDAHPFIFDWALIYRLLWDNLEPGVFDEAAEVAFLEEQLRRADRAPVFEQRAMVAITYFYLKEDKDEAIWAMLRRAVEAGKQVHLADYLVYVADFMQREQWVRALTWLRQLSAFPVALLVGETVTLCQYWQTFADKYDLHDEYLAYLRQWLPWSDDYYQEQLLHMGQYEQWVEWQLHKRCYPADVERRQWKMVEKAAPHLLLPIYHQAIAGLIRLKQRKAYQEATKLMKKLRTLYRKQKKQDQWQRYLVHLTTRFARLRALQEEMRKGQLIN